MASRCAGAGFWTCEAAGGGSASPGGPPGIRPTVETLAPVVAGGGTLATATLKATVNPKGYATKVHFLYGTGGFLVPSQAVGLPAGSADVEVSIVVDGLALSTAYSVTAYATHTDPLSPYAGVAVAGDAVAFTTPAAGTTPPTAITLPATVVGATSATLNGLVNPNSTQTSAGFVLVHPVSGIVTTAAYQDCGAGSAQVAISEEVTGLDPEIEYQYHIVAANTALQISKGSPTNFTTLAETGGSAPEIVSLQIVQITDTTALARVRYDDKGVACDVAVQYGTSTAYGFAEFVLQVPAGTTSVALPLSGLTASTLYHIRALLNSENGGDVGEDVQFKTTGALGAPTGDTSLPSGINENFVTLNAEINPQGGLTSVKFYLATSLLDLEDPLTRRELDADATSSASATTVFTTTATNLLPYTLYYYRAVATNTVATITGKVVTLRTAGGIATGAPAVVTSAASFVFDTQAQINGTINASTVPTSYYFEYWITGVDKVFTTAKLIDFPLVGLAGTQTVSERPQNLIANQAYNFRLCAVSAGDPSVQYGSTLTFTTAAAPGSPRATGTIYGVTDMTASTALCRGNVNPQGTATTAYFEASTTPNFAVIAADNSATAQSLGSGTLPVELTPVRLTGLTASTRYYFRVRMSNTGGTSYSVNSAQATTGTAVQPTVVTGTPGSITSTSAIANSTVTLNALNGEGDVFAWFGYGTAAVPGAVNYPFRTPEVNLGNVPLSVLQPTALLPGLPSSTTIYVRAFARLGSAISTGAEVNFATLAPGSGNFPAANVGAASEVIPNGFNMSGTEQTNGSQTTVVFGGRNAAPGSTETWAAPRTSAAQVISDNAKLQLVGANTWFLELGSSTWQYRIRATNAAGTTYSEASPDVGCPAPVTLPTLVTNVGAGISRFQDLESTRLRFNIAHKGQRLWMQLEYAATAGDLITNPTIGRRVSYQGPSFLAMTCRYADYLTGLSAGTTRFYRLRCWSKAGDHTGASGSVVTDSSGWAANWAAALGTQVPVRNCMGTIPSDFRTGTGTISKTNEVDFGTLTYATGEDAYSIIVTPTGVTTMWDGVLYPLVESASTNNSCIALALKKARVGDKIWVDASQGWTYRIPKLGRSGAGNNGAFWPNNKPITAVRILPKVAGTTVLITGLDCGADAGSWNGVYFKGFSFRIGTTGRNYSVSCEGASGAGGGGLLGLYDCTFVATDTANWSGYGAKTHIRTDAPITPDFRRLDFSPVREHSIYRDSPGEINPQASLDIDCRVTGLSADGLRDANGNTFIQDVSRGDVQQNAAFTGPGYPPARGTHTILRCTSKSGTTGPTAFSIYGHFGTVNIEDCIDNGTALEPNKGGTVLVSDDSNGGSSKGIWFNELGYAINVVNVSNLTVNAPNVAASLIKVWNCQEFHMGTFTIANGVNPQKVFDFHAAGLHENRFVEITAAGLVSGALFSYAGWGDQADNRKIFHNNNSIAILPPYPDFDDLATGKQYSAVQ